MLGPTIKWSFWLRREQVPHLVAVNRPGVPAPILRVYFYA
jgi:hypothetical protein